MSKTAIVTVRIDEAVKQEAQSVLSRAGVSCSRAVQGLFDYIVMTGETPEFALDSYWRERRSEHPEGTYAALNEWVRNAPWGALDFRGITDDEFEVDRADHLVEKAGLADGGFPIDGGASE